MHYYKILKHKAGFDEGTSYWEKLLARYLAATGGGKIHTTLPITFTSTSWKLVSWTIYGNNTPNNYSAEGTLPLTFTTQTAGAASDWSISGNDNIGKNKVRETWRQATDPKLIIGTSTVDTPLGTSWIISRNDDSLKVRIYGLNQQGKENIEAGLAAGTGNSFNIFSGQFFTEPRTFTNNNNNIVAIVVQLGNIDNTALTPETVGTNVVMVRPADTSADFEPYQVGVGQRTKNKLEITATTQEINGVTFTIDKEAGTITANGTEADNTTIGVNNYVTVDATGRYILSGCPAGGSYQTWEVTIQDGNTIVGRARPNPATVTLTAGVLYTVRCVVRNHVRCDNLVFKPMVIPADTSNTFIPYGYQIPITVSQQGQPDKTVDIYIGDSPLTEGETVSKTSTGVDIAAIAGSNTITTELYNKPEMAITGVDYVGVGERTVNLYNPNATDVNNGYVKPGRLRPNGTINPATIAFTIWVTEYIAVEPERAYTLVDLMQSSAYGICYYNASKTYLSGEAYNVTDHGNKTITTPADCKYIRFTGAENYNTMLVKGSTAPATYIPYGYEIPISVQGENLFDKTATDISKGFEEKRYIKNNGSTVGNANWNISEYLNVQSSAKYMLIYGSNNETPGVCYYTSEKEYISGVAYNNQTVIVLDTPINAKYIRFSYTRSDNVNPILQKVLNYAFYINSPLTAGQSISKTSTGVDLEVFEGENTIDTTLYNKPEMEIVYE